MPPLRSTGHWVLDLELSSHLAATTNSTTTVTGTTGKMSKQAMLFSIQNIVLSDRLSDYLSSHSVQNSRWFSGT